MKSNSYCGNLLWQSSLTLRRPILVVVMACVCVALKGSCTSDSDARHEGLHGRRGSTKALVCSSMENRRILEPPARYPTKVEKDALTRIFLDILEAYTNGSVHVMKEKMSLVPDGITNIAHSVFIEIQRPLCCVFRDSFAVVRQRCVGDKVISLESHMRDFSSVDEFVDFAERNVQMTLFLGGIELRRGASSGSLVLLDKGMLKWFNEYREKFAREGKKELWSQADEFYQKWCEHIESEDGFVRNYVRFQVELQMSGGKTREQAVTFARGAATGIIRCGYTPKWLDEEFPLLSEDATKAGLSD